MCFFYQQRQLRLSLLYVSATFEEEYDSLILCLYFLFPPPSFSTFTLPAPFASTLNCFTKEEEEDDDCVYLSLSGWLAG